MSNNLNPVEVKHGLIQVLMFPNESKVQMHPITYNPVKT